MAERDFGLSDDGDPCNLHGFVRRGLGPDRELDGHEGIKVAGWP